jgi:hypothetical protein
MRVGEDERVPPRALIVTRDVGRAVRLTRPERSRIGEHRQFKHRAGWPFVVDQLQQASGFPDMLLEDYVEYTFSTKPRQPTPTDVLKASLRSMARWILPPSRNPLVWTEPWVGIFHNPPNVPSWFHAALDPADLLNGLRLRQSLPQLRGAVALSEYLAAWLRQRLDAPVIALKHPTAFDARQFDWDAFEANPEKKLVQIGWYLRNYRAIYQVSVPPWLTKAHLVQNEPVIIDARQATDEHAETRHRPDVGAVQELSYLPADAYDRLLTDNLVFIEVITSSANNAVVEAIARDTPIVINRHPAVVEYLGPDYPLLYDDIAQVQSLLTIPRIRDAHAYIRAMDKTDLTVEHFIDQMRRFMLSLA